MDDRAILWNVEKVKYIQILEGHQSYVQGVCFDHKMKFIVTMSNDKSARVYKLAKSKKNINYYLLNIIKKHEASPEKFYKYFLDENQLFTFFRRPDFSPDGSFFIVPTSISVFKRLVWDQQRFDSLCSSFPKRPDEFSLSLLAN